MKILNTRDLRKEAGMKDWVVDKGKGFFDMVRNVFQDSDKVNGENYAEDMIDQLEDEQFETETAMEILQSPQPEFQPIGAGNIPGMSPAQHLAVSLAGTGQRVKIGYLTKDYLTYIVRNIRPESTFRALTTNNDILLSKNESEEYRAFIIRNIVSAEKIEETENFGVQI
jgi:hypothetical protein